MPSKDSLPIGVDPPVPVMSMSRWSLGTVVSPIFIIAIIMACGLLVWSSGYILRTSTTLQVSVSPSASSIIQRTGIVKSLSDAAVTQWAESIVQVMESWNNETLKDHSKRVIPSVHSRYRATVTEDYVVLFKQVKDLYFSRAVSVYAADIVTKEDGRYLVNIPYEQFDYSGLGRASRVAVAPTDWVMQMEVVQDLPTDENPVGLFIIARTKITREAWLKAERKNYWPTLKVPK